MASFSVMSGMERLHDVMDAELTTDVVVKCNMFSVQLQ